MNRAHPILFPLFSSPGEGKGELFTEIKQVLGQKVPGQSHQDLADRLGMSVGAVKVAVHRLRKRYRESLEQQIGRTLDDASDAGIAEEVRYLFGIFAR